MKKNIFTSFATAAFCAVLLTACNNEGEKKAEEVTTAPTMTADTATKPVETPKDIVDIAMGSADHSTLVAAVKAAGLVETLKGAGPFTIFAPLMQRSVLYLLVQWKACLLPEKKADLTGILTYHVVSGAVKAADLKDGQKIKTLQGGELPYPFKEGKSND